MTSETGANPLTIIHLRGTQAEMGAQYGRLLQERGRLPETENTLSTLGRRMLEDANSRGALGQIQSMLLRGRTEFLLWRLHRHRLPQYRARSEAFLNTLELQPSLLRQVPITDVFQNIVGLAARIGYGPFKQQTAPLALPSCSSLAVWGRASSDGRLRHARNFDFPCAGTWDAHPKVSFCTPDEGLRYGYIDTVSADATGINGFNEAGLTLGAHTRFHRSTRYDGACVLDLCHEIVRRASSLDEAIAIAKERPVAANWGLCVSSAADGRAISIETTADGVRVLEGEDHITVTNLHLHPDHQVGQVCPFPAWSAHADGRRQRLESIARWGLEGTGLSLNDLIAALGDTGEEADQRAGSILAQAISVTSVVFEPEARRMVLSVGDCPTGFGPYTTVDWSWDSPVGLREIIPTDLVAPRKRFPTPNVDAGHALWRQAVRAAYDRHDDAEQLTLIESAIAQDPEAPSYRLMAGLLRLRQRDWSTAIQHLEVGILNSKDTFRTGQFHLWIARVYAVMGHFDAARQHRAMLNALEGPHIDSLHALAAQDEHKPVSARRLARLVYSLDLVDAAA